MPRNRRFGANFRHHWCGSPGRFFPKAENVVHFVHTVQMDILCTSRSRTSLGSSLVLHVWPGRTKKVGFVSSKRLPDEIFGFHWVPADTGIKRKLLQKRKYSAKQYQKEINCVV